MISATYNRRETCLTIKGHAQSAPKGEDLICAAASILAYTAIAAVQDNDEKYLPSITQHDGEMRISCNPSSSYITPCRRVLDTIYTGYEILANEYPDHVRVKREE